MLASPSVARPAAGDTRVDFEKGMSLFPLLSLVLIVANIVVFFITLFQGALASRESIIIAGALVRDRVVQGEVWRPFSAMFLHAGFDHLLGNCIALYILGMACEHAYGLTRMCGIYFLAGLGGASLSLAVSPGPSVGASGAIFGLMGAAIVFFYKHHQHFLLRDKRVGTVLIAWAIYSIVTAFFTPYIDNAAHVGGLLSGAAAAACLHPPLLERVASARE